MKFGFALLIVAAQEDIMKMTSCECGVILLMLGLCLGSAQHPGMDNEIQDDSQTVRLKWGSSVVEAQSCPTWYLETKHNGVSRCVCCHIRRLCDV